MGEMKKCKHCQSEIDKKAKVCPNCRKKQKGKGGIIAIAAAAIVIIAFASSGSDDEPKKVDNTTKEASVTKNDDAKVTETKAVDKETEKEEKIYTVGDSVELNNIIVTFNGVKESNGGEYNKPSDGSIYVLPEFTIENNSDKELNMSTLLSFDAYQDGFSTSLSLSALIEKENSEQLDGTIAPGKKMKGMLGYEVPRNYKELEVNVQLDVWSNKKIVFRHNK